MKNSKTTLLIILNTNHSNNTFKGSDRQCIVVKLNMQYCGQIFKDLFETYKMFLRRIFTEFERKVIFKIMNFDGYVLRIGFLKLSYNDDKKCKQNSTETN